MEEHLAECADCRGEVAIWKKLSLLPAEAAERKFARAVRSDAACLPDRAERQAAAGFERPKRSPMWNWLRSPLGAVAWSAALLAMGIFAGNYWGARTTRSNPNENEIAAMHSELTNMRQLVVLSMLQQQSASERLQGVSYSQREGHLDPQVLSALVHTLRFDNSVDVRLAALDALSRHGRPTTGAERRRGCSAGAAIAAGAGGADRSNAGMARSGCGPAAAQFCANTEFESDGAAARGLGAEQIELRRRVCAERSFFAV